MWQKYAKLLSVLLMGSFFWGTIAWIAPPQDTQAQVKTEVEQALRTHIKGIYPLKGCLHNECAYSFTKGFKFTKNQQVGGTLRLWGKANVRYKCPFTAEKAVITFYTELKKVDGAVRVTKMRWQPGPCMKLQTLYQE